MAADYTKLENALKENNDRIDKNNSGIDSLNANLSKISNYLDTISTHITSTPSKQDDGTSSNDSNSKFSKDFIKSFENFGSYVSKFGSSVNEFGLRVFDFRDGINKFLDATQTQIASSGKLNNSQEEQVNQLSKAVMALAQSNSGSAAKIDWNTTKDQIEKMAENMATYNRALEDASKKLEKTDNEKRVEERKKKEEKILKENSKSQKEFYKELKEDWKLERQEKKTAYAKAEKRLENKAKRKEKGGTANIIGNALAKGFSDLANGKLTTSSAMDKVVNATSNIPILGPIVSIFKTLFDIGTKKEKDAQAYVRTHGGGSSAMSQYIGQSMEVVNKGLSLNDAFGFKNKVVYTDEDFNKALNLISEGTGRGAFSKSYRTIKSAADLARWNITPETIKAFDTFGQSIENTDKRMASIYGRAGKIGVSFKALSNAVNSNLKMAQTHTFASGLKGLERMAEKSVELKYNMNTVAAAADKMGNLEGAIKASSQLSVLGGSFAAFADPMALLNESMTDLESLNERIINMFGDKAYFDKEKGEISMNAFNRMRMKSASEALGVNFEDMLNIAYNSERGNIIERQAGGGLNEDTMRYLKNVAEIDESGNAYISDSQGEKIYVSQLSDQDKKFIEAISTSKDVVENETLGGIWGETMTTSDKLDNIFTYLQQKLGVWVMGLFNKFKAFAAWAAEKWGDPGEEARNAGLGAVYDQLEHSLKSGYSKSQLAEDLANGNIKRVRENSNVNGKEIQKLYDYYSKKAKASGYVIGNGISEEDSVSNVQRSANAQAVHDAYTNNTSPNNATTNQRYSPRNNSSANYMSSSSYSAPSTQVSYTTKINVSPIEIKLGGEIELKNTKSKIDISSLSQAEMNELTTKLAPLIQKQIINWFEQGNNFDNNIRYAHLS